MMQPVEKTPPDRADTATDDAEGAARALPPSKRVPTPPAAGTPAAAFLASLNAAYEVAQDPEDVALPRAMRSHMRRVLEQER